MNAQRTIGAGALIAGLLLSGCANTPAPTEQLAVSKKALDDATSAGGAEYAPLALKTARDRMDSAERAMDKENYVEARRLAEAAAVDAQLAEATAQAEKAAKAVDGAQQAQRALREELNRQQTP